MPSVFLILCARPPRMEVKADFMAAGTQFAELGPYRRNVWIRPSFLDFGEFHRLGEHYKRRIKFFEDLRQPLRWIEHEFPQRTLSVAIDLVIQREDELNHDGATSANRPLDPRWTEADA